MLYNPLARLALHVTQDIIDELDRGNEEQEKLPASPTWDEMNRNYPVNVVTSLPRRATKSFEGPLTIFHTNR